MCKKVYFLLITEGSSDYALKDHLQNIIVECGADEAIGVAPDLARLPTPVGISVKDKVEAALRLEPSVNIIFIHRDSDAVNPEPRYTEISTQVSSLSTAKPYVAIVPVQELEAWLLVDEASIRSISENPLGTASLNLPKIKNIEKLSNPKEKLYEALALASEKSGRHLDKFKQSLPKKRTILIERMKTTGAIQQLQSWTRMKNDIQLEISKL